MREITRERFAGIDSKSNPFKRKGVGADICLNEAGGKLYWNPFTGRKNNNVLITDNVVLSVYYKLFLRELALKMSAAGVKLYIVATKSDYREVAQTNGGEHIVIPSDVDLNTLKGRELNDLIKIVGDVGVFDFGALSEGVDTNIDIWEFLLNRFIPSLDDGQKHMVIVDYKFDVNSSYIRDFFLSNAGKDFWQREHVSLVFQDKRRNLDVNVDGLPWFSNGCSFEWVLYGEGICQTTPSLTAALLSHELSEVVAGYGKNDDENIQEDFNERLNACIGKHGLIFKKNFFGDFKERLGQMQKNRSNI